MGIGRAGVSRLALGFLVVARRAEQDMSRFTSVGAAGILALGWDLVGGRRSVGPAR